MVFPPVFPLYIPALAPLHYQAPLIWLGGLACLWLTRYTHPLGKRWRVANYALSGLVRLAGMVLIALGWLALYAPLPGWQDRLLFTGRPAGWQIGRAHV